MKYLPRTKKQVIITSTIAVAVVAILIAVFFVAANQANTARQNSAVPTVTEKSAEDIEETVVPTAEVPVAETAEEAAPASQQSKTQNGAATAPEKTQEEVRMETMCNGVTEFINTRYIQKKDASGSPYYQSNDVLLNDLKRQSPANYAFYQECVAAGKIQSL